MIKSYLNLTLSTVGIVALTACGNASNTVANAAGQAGETASKMGADVIQATSGAMPSLSFGDVPSATPNYIFMIGDDMGQETLSCYNIGTAAAHTPNLDKLCAAGLRFDNFWSQPVCSPTRATLLTGQYGFMNGVGAPLGPTPGIEWNIPGGNVNDNPARGGMAGGGMAAGMAGMAGNAVVAGSIAVASDVDLTAGAPAPDAPTENSDKGLRPGFYTFLHALKSDASKDYQTAAVGKWHLSGSENTGLSHPLEVGFDHYIGPMRGGGVATYTGWSKSDNGGDPFGKTGYVTSDTVDDGIAFIDTVEGEKPFFLWVAFNAPHTPFHMPPAELLSSDLKNLTEETSTPLQQYNAMIEAMDTEIGRLIASLEPETLANTYITFMGDNGTPGQADQAEPYGRTKSKGSLYQGGVNVPFFVAGPGVPASATPALANSVDIYKTVLDISGVSAPKAAEAVHSVSLKPVLLENANENVRDFVFADVHGVSGPTRKNIRTVSDGRYKLIENILDNTVELYDLKSDPYETKNLLSGTPSDSIKAAHASLRAKLVKLVSAN